MSGSSWCYVPVSPRCSRYLPDGNPNIKYRNLSEPGGSHEPEAETNLGFQYPMGQTRTPPFGPPRCAPLTARHGRSPHFGAWSLGRTRLLPGSSFEFRISRPRCGLGTLSLGANPSHLRSAALSDVG